MQSVSAYNRGSSNFHLSNALVQAFIQDLQAEETSTTDAQEQWKGRLDRLAFAVHKLADDIRQGSLGAIDPEAIQGLLLRLQRVQYLGQDSKFSHHLFIKRIFCPRILQLATTLQDSAEGIPQAEREAIKELKQVVKWLRQSLKDAIPDASGVPWNSPPAESAMAAEELSVALHHVMAREHGHIGQSQEALEGGGELGSKWKNLLIMADLQDVLQTPEFFVPRPVGIFSQKIVGFLKRCAPRALEAWDELRELYQTRDVATVFLQQEAAKQKIKEIQETIQAAFDGLAQDLVTWDPEDSTELDAMIIELERSGDYAIVRSTGAEDTQAAANAGGNISVSYVPPNREDIMRAVGAVVASYFDIDSLKNRLDAGQDPFAERLQLAVLVQQLIGEPVLRVGTNNTPEKIPISFVCFSSEPLYVGTECFRIMRISATYGHGEGVVGTQGIATDSWLILYSALHPQRLYIIPDIKNKTERLAAVQEAPGEKPKLKKVKNPKVIAKLPALSPEQLRSIVINALINEARLGNRAADIEGICRKEGTYFVQIRDVNRPPHEAEYVDIGDLKEHQRAAILDLLQAIPLVPGRSNVVEITMPDQLIVTETLEQALKLYSAKLDHRLVVVSTPSPLLSHAVVNFSHLGVPCLLTRDKEAIAKMRARIDTHHPLEVCTQTATLYLWDPGVADPHAFIKRGFGAHPAKISPSPLSHSLRLGKPRETPSEIRDLLLSIRSAIVRRASRDALEALRKLRKHPLIAGIKEAHRQQEQALQDNPDAPLKAKEIHKALLEYESMVKRTFKEAKAVFSRPDALVNEENRLERLFHAAALEKILLEPLEEPGAVGRCSLMQVGSMVRATSELVAYQQQLGRPALFADLLLNVLPSNPDPALFHEWKDFLLSLETEAQRGKITPAQVNQFKVIMKTLRKSGVLPMWFMFYFNSVGILPGCRRSTISTFHSLLTQFKRDAAFLEELTTTRLEIKRLNEQMDRFAHPETFKEAWRDLEKVVILWSSNALCRQIKSASPLTQNMAYQTMEQLVTTLDTAVKTMKIGAGFADKLKQIRLFKKMLLPYHTLMQTWALQMVPTGALPIHPEWPIKRYVETLNTTLSGCGFYREDELTRNFLPSKDFSVNAAVLGAKTDFWRHRPETLEDCLTLEHQNLLVFLSVLNLRSLSTRTVNASRLPTTFKHVLKTIETPQRQNHIQRVGLAVTENEIIYRGNYPLRNHSGQLELIYDKSTQQMAMKVHFMGEARERFGIISDWVKMLDGLKKVRLQGSVEKGAQEIAFAWNVDPTTISALMREFFQMGEYTLTAMSGGGELIENVITRLIPPAEIEENTVTTNNIFNFCNRNTKNKFVRFFIESAIDGNYPHWVLDGITAEAIQHFAKMFLQQNGEWHRAVNILQRAFDQQRITRTAIAAIFAPYVRFDGECPTEPVMLAEGPLTEATTVPSEAELTSQDLWTQSCAFYHLQLLVEKGDPMAIRLAQQMIQDLLQAERLPESPIRDFCGIMLCDLVQQEMAYEEAAEWCYRSFPNPQLRQSLCDKDQHALLLSKVINPKIKSLQGDHYYSQDADEILECFNVFVSRDIGISEAWAALPVLAPYRASADISALIRRLLEKNPTDEDFEQMALFVKTHPSDPAAKILKTAIRNRRP